MKDSLRFHIIINGQSDQRVPLDQIKSNFSKRFFINEQKTEQIFSGKPCMFKRNVDSQTAEKYRFVLNRMGIDVKLKLLKSQTAKTTAAKPQQGLLSKISQPFKKLAGQAS